MARPVAWLFMLTNNALRPARAILAGPYHLEDLPMSKIARKVSDLMIAGDMEGAYMYLNSLPKKQAIATALEITCHVERTVDVREVCDLFDWLAG